LQVGPIAIFHHNSQNVKEPIYLSCWKIDMGQERETETERGKVVLVIVFFSLMGVFVCILINFIGSEVNDHVNL